MHADSVRHRIRARARVGLLTAAVGLAPGLLWAEGATGVVQPVRPGDLFPAATYKNLNSAQAANINLADVLTKKPVVLVYWIPGHDRSEEMLRKMEALRKEVGEDRLALYGVAVPRPGREADAIRERARALGIGVPVLEDNGFRVGQQLKVQSVPNVSIIDRRGRLRLTNGASLTQALEYKIDLAAAVRRTAETGELATYGSLDRYYPVKELIGRTCPDFHAPLVTGRVEQSWHSLLDAKKLNVLIFWSIDCPHCRKSLPEINAWLREHPEGVNVVSAAMVGNDADTSKTKEYCELNKFVFPTLLDRDSEISNRFMITSTPTILIIGPDGVIDSVMVSSYTDFGKTIEEKRRELVKSVGS